MAWLWHDGRLSEDDSLTLPANDRGLLLGDGLFETLLLQDGRLWRKAWHLRRLRDAAAILALPLDARIEQALQDLANAAPTGCHVLRLTVTRGPGARGLRLPEQIQPSVFARLLPWTLAPGQPLRLVQSGIRRNETSPLSRLKTLNYLDNILALDNALARGADDALLLNMQGRVACTSAANLCMAVGDTLFTPPIDDGVLPGITRQVVQEKAGAIGLAMREQSLAVADLPRARAVFALNSLRLAQPVQSLDGADMPQDAVLLQRINDLLLADIQSSPR